MKTCTGTILKEYQCQNVLYDKFLSLAREGVAGIQRKTYSVNIIIHNNNVRLSRCCVAKFVKDSHLNWTTFMILHRQILVHEKQKKWWDQNGILRTYVSSVRPSSTTKYWIAGCRQSRIIISDGDSTGRSNEDTTCEMIERINDIVIKELKCVRLLILWASHLNGCKII